MGDAWPDDVRLFPRGIRIAQLRDAPPADWSLKYIQVEFGTGFPPPETDAPKTAPGDDVPRQQRNRAVPHLSARHLFLCQLPPRDRPRLPLRGPRSCFEVRAKKVDQCTQRGQSLASAWVV